MIQRLQDVLDKIQAYHPAADVELVRKSYEFASKAHEGQFRKSGDPYVVHPISVASVIADLKLDVPSVCAGMLHDCVEDTSTTVEELSTRFGEEIAFLVDGVTKIGKIPWNTKEERQAENFRKMLIAMARDIRVILIKLADRTDNMRTLQHMPADKQERIARETLDIYAPLANRLGIQWVKCELEDLSFRYLEPLEWKALSAKVSEQHGEWQKYIDSMGEGIHREMVAAGIECDVSGRVKHLYSTYLKMKKSGRELEQIHDLIAFRVITRSVKACYEALGVAHSSWTPIPGRFKDYIALPKPNMYQSLHTSVIGPNGERMEIQIRTEEMHRIADEGIAAHWTYKEGKSRIDPKDVKKFAWLKQLMELQRDLKDPTEFFDSVKIDLFQDEVYVFTPKGDVKALVKGATPVDFAYEIHSKVGDRCSGARVNGLIVPLRYQLRNGDTIEIITSATQKPSKDWLKFVATSRAKSKIRYYIRTEQRERAKELGKDLLERELRRYGVSWGRADKDGSLEKAAKHFRQTTVDELCTFVGYGKFTPAAVIEQIVPEDQRKSVAPPDDGESKNPLTKLFRRVTGRRPLASGIKVQGEDDIMVRFAKCCAPVSGDPIIGFITRGRGVTIHTRDCQKAIDVDPDRRVDVTWDEKSRAPRPVQVQVVCADKPGLLAEMSRAFTEAGVNIAQAHCRTTDDRRAVNTFQFSVQDLEQLKGVLRTIQRISGVYSVERLKGTTM